jgi:zinc transporter ZupT
MKFGRTWGIGIGAFTGAVLGGIIGYVVLGSGVGIYIDIILGAVAGASLAGASLRGLWPLLWPWWLSMDEGPGLIFWAPAFYVS